MRKILLINKIILFIFLLAMAFTFVGCNQTNDDLQVPENTPTANEETPTSTVNEETPTSTMPDITTPSPATEPPSPTVNEETPTPLPTTPSPTTPAPTIPRTPAPTPVPTPTPLPPVSGGQILGNNASSIFTAEPLPDEIIEFITGVTFHANTPFTHDFLSYLTLTHFNFRGQRQIGHMIVAAEIAQEVLDIFRDIYRARFPIFSIRLIDYFNADDNLSIAANNSSAFNFRTIAGTNTISRHGFGKAIDINPIQNPYIRHGRVLPEAGRAYLDRRNVRPGMIVPGDAVYRAFTSRGWIWGGRWTNPIDYHHFERRR